MTLKKQPGLLKPSIMSVRPPVTQSPTLTPPPPPRHDHSSVEHESKAMAIKLSSHFSPSFSPPHCSLLCSTKPFVFAPIKSTADSQAPRLPIVPNPTWLHTNGKERVNPATPTRGTWPWIHLQAFGLFIDLFYGSVGVHREKNSPGT